MLDTQSLLSRQTVRLCFFPCPPVILHVFMLSASIVRGALRISNATQRVTNGIHVSQCREMDL